VPVTKETLDEVATISGVMTCGEDYMPQHVRAECERVIPHVDEVKPAEAADAFLFLKVHYQHNQTSTADQ
jgi:hypothetical protein